MNKPQQVRPRSNGRLKFRPVRMIYVLLFFCLILLGNHQIVDVDIWWHLRTAKFMLQTHQIPTTDIFTQPSAGKGWIDLHWLYQLALYAIWSVGGAGAITAAKTVILGMTFLLLAVIASRRFSSTAFASLMLLGLVSFERYLPRPEIVSYLLVAIYLAILHRYRQHGGRWIWLLPFLQILWTNMEGLFVLGLVLIGAFALGESAESCLRPAAGPGHSHIVRLWLALLLCVFGSLCNPYGWKGLTFPFILYTRLGAGKEIFSSTIAELMPPPLNLYPSLHYPLLFIDLLIAVSLLSAIANHRRLSYGWVLVYAAFLFLAIRARRNIPLFVCVAVPFAAMNFHAFARQATQRRKYAAVGVRLLRFVSITSTAAGSVLLLWALNSGLYAAAYMPLAQPGSSFSPYMYPQGAVEFIRRTGLAGNMFNNIGIGGYLIWDLYPHQRVFIDGRLEVHGRKFYTEYATAMRQPRYWNLLARKYNIEYVVLQHTMADTLRLITHLHRSPQWRLVFYDDRSAIFVREQGINSAVAEKYGPAIEKRLRAQSGRLEDPPTPPVSRGGVPCFHIPFRDIALGTLMASLERYPGALNFFSKALQQCPNRFELLYNISLVLTKLGRNVTALSYARAALAHRPRSASALDHTGILLLRCGRPAEAERCFRKAIAAEPHYIKAHYDLGIFLLNEGRLDQAQSELEKACGRFPRCPQLHWALALCHYQAGAYRRAVEEARIAAQIDPLLASAYALTGAALSRLGEYTPAAEAYQQALACQPDDVGSLINLGSCYARMGAYQHARDCWLRALALQPTNTALRGNLTRLEKMKIHRRSEP